MTPKPKKKAAQSAKGGKAREALTQGAKKFRETLFPGIPVDAVIKVAEEARAAIDKINNAVATLPAKLPTALPESETLGVLDQVVNAITTGKDISSLAPVVNRLISNQESRAELINALMQTHNYERLARYAKLRDKAERRLMEAAENRELTPGEYLNLLSLVMEETERVSTHVRNGATSIKDVVALMNKADYAMQAREAELEKKFANTTPQGREIARRLAYRAMKFAKAATPDS